MLKLFSKMLGDAYDVATADDGARALALLAAREFDVVVTDLKMPGADGLAVLREVKRARPRNRGGGDDRLRHAWRTRWRP